MRTAVMLFTRDLRIHDNPALAAACDAGERVVPLYVDDPAETRNANRRRFLLDALTDLRSSLRALGADLLVRRGDTAEAVMAVCRATGARALAAAEDYGREAARTRRSLREACERERIALRLLPGVTVVPPGRLRPAGGGDHYRVFTPYWRAWSNTRLRDTAAEPGRIALPEGVHGDDPAAVIATGGEAARVPPGGETAALGHLDDWAVRGVDYAAVHDDLAADATSRLSPHLAFGCLSARALAADPRVPDAMVRQLCWRDFHHQVLADFPDLDRRAYRRGDDEDWADDPDAVDAWRRGETGVPIVDAAMRQLLAEGWMHNRARLIAAGYLTKTLGLDWREGAAHFEDHLVDLDVADNGGNWQWTAGTGNDTRPNRGFNAERQARRFDPHGAYRERWLGEDFGGSGMKPLVRLT